MKNYSVFIIIISIIAFTVYSPDIFTQSVTFDKTFGTSSSSMGLEVHELPNGEFLIVGVITSISAYVYLLKATSDGQLIWEKKPGIGGSAGISFTLTDNGYIIAGTTYRPGHTDYDIYILRLNSNGDTLSTKIIGGSGNQHSSKIIQTLDNGYVIVGWTEESSGIPLLKLNRNGDIEWYKLLSADSLIRGFDIHQLADSGYIIVGKRYNKNYSQSGIYLIRTDSVGNIVWTKTYWGTGKESGNSILVSSDGGFVIAGSSSKDIYIFGTNSDGDSLWAKRFNGYGDGEANCISSLDDGDFIITGRIGTTRPDNISDLLLMKIDSSGNIIWSNNFGSTITDYGNSVRQTLDGGFILTGCTYRGQNGGPAVYLLKTNENGLTSVKTKYNNIDLYDFKLMHNYPNPFNPITTIKFILPYSDNVELNIYNILGEKIITLINSYYNEGEHQVNWDASKFTSGVYFYKLKTSHYTDIKKLLLLK